ncbi:hypothetical protein [Anaplasma capra]|uniref:hypothetical protein n=1 Tax=Anaplasma capra TaxID=1562740 RepID=UPI0021D5730C|nr:hypothetical protein [Anaplasma capra]MCU7611262.1 hypothetical protein [Anaplasma capra]MCU7612689.1 hypothetical protein [Anaplasma capra]
MLSPKQASYSVPAITNDNTPLFFTAELRGLAKLLVDKNSLSMLSGFLAGAVGTNEKMEEHPYTNILQHNLKLHPKDLAKLTNSQHGHYRSIWITEILYRSLVQVTQKYGMGATPLKHLADRCAAKINKLHGKELAYNISSQKSIICIQELSAYLQRMGVSEGLGMGVIMTNSLKALDDLSSYCALEMRERFCLLLSFYGASCDALPSSCSSVTLVRRILHGEKVVYTPTRNLSVQELECRQQIWGAVASYLGQQKRKLEYAKVITHRQYAWYMLHHKLVQFFYTVFIIPKLCADYDTLKRLDAAYKDSITYGDCSKFFEKLQRTALLDKDFHREHRGLFAALNAAQSSYKVGCHAEYVAAVRSCASKHRPALLQHLSFSAPVAGGVLRRASHKVCKQASVVRSRLLKSLPRATASGLLPKQSIGQQCIAAALTTASAHDQFNRIHERPQISEKQKHITVVSRFRPNNDNTRPHGSSLKRQLELLLSRKKRELLHGISTLALHYAGSTENLTATESRTFTHGVRHPKADTHVSKYLAGHRGMHTHPQHATPPYNNLHVAEPTSQILHADSTACFHPQTTIASQAKLHSHQFLPSQPKPKNAKFSGKYLKKKILCSVGTASKPKHLDTDSNVHKNYSAAAPEDAYVLLSTQAQQRTRKCKGFWLGEKECKPDTRK